MSHALNHVSLDDLLTALEEILEKGDDEFDGVLSEREPSRAQRRSAWKEQCATRRRRLLGLAQLFHYRENFLSPINRLPLEIFSSIILLLKPQDTFTLRSDEWRGTAHSLIKVTHVCRHWRISALNTPRLWSSIYLDPSLISPAAVAIEFLRRSFPVAVSLTQEFGPSRISKRERSDLEPFYSSFARQSDRVSSISVKGYLFSEGLGGAVFRPIFPNITSLRVESTSINYYVHGEEEDEESGEDEESWEDEERGQDATTDNQQEEEGPGLVPVLIDVHLRHGQTLDELGPTLQRLYMRNFGWWIDRRATPFLFPTSLTHLYLVRSEGLALPSDITDTVRSLTALEVLHLENIYHRGVPYDGQMIELNTLRKMRLRIDNLNEDSIAMFPLCLLQRLSVPTTTKTMWSADLTVNKHLGQVAVHQLPPLSRLSLVTKIFIVQGNGSYFMLQGDALLYRRKNISNGQKQLSCLAEYLPNVKLVGISSIQEFRSNYTLLQSYTSLEHLELYTHHALQKLVSVLEAKSPGGGSVNQESTGQELLCPLLRSITVYTGAMDTRDPVIGEKVLRRMAGINGFPLKMPDSGVITRQRPALGTTYDIFLKTGDACSVLLGHGLDVQDVWQLDT